MKSDVRVVPLERIAAPFLAIALGTSNTTNGKVPSSLLGLESHLQGALGRVLDSGDFKGERDETAVVYPAKGPKRVMLVGLGKGEEFTRGALRRAASIAARKAVAAGAESMAFFVPPEGRGGITPTAIGQVALEGAGQGAWQFKELKAPDEKRVKLRSFELIASREDRADMERGRKIGAAIAVGQRLARNLQALPGNVCTPTYLTTIARQLGQAYGFRVTAIGRQQLEKAGMGGILAVAQGSAEDPQLISLEYHGTKKSAPICLVGKGVTFDSGGISIKPAQNMEDMKYDMSGAAAVLGTFEMLGQLKPEVNVVGLIPATENLPSGTAIKPGDVIKSHFGKTIEIVNTDAEGRLILADALSHARRFKPACVIDAATLTGAITVALGSQAIGLMGNDEQLISEIRKAGESAGERCWPLPLWDEFRELNKSDVADVKNSGGRGAGSISAGWFLREFVDGFPWAHLDIAGTAYTDRDTAPMAKGPTGIGVRLFSEFILTRAGG
ncbi:MAG: leucyl aminopeptidase [Gemmatimonadetes bacterium]|nr:leucyl aminopeptidase [Gemmatimonadota bacterium]